MYTYTYIDTYHTYIICSVYFKIGSSCFLFFSQKIVNEFCCGTLQHCRLAAIHMYIYMISLSY